MCGRVFCTLSPKDLIRIAGAKCIGSLENVSKSFNICPTSCIPAIKGSKEMGKFIRTIESMVWGAKTPFSFVINCRGEELHEKRFFKPLLETNRCVFIFEGYYEWNPQKQPFAFYSNLNNSDIDQAEETKNLKYEEDGNDTPKKDSINEKRKFKPIFMAGLFTQNDEGMILTIESDEKFGEVHHRVPVLLEEDEIDKWLNYEKYRFSDLIESLMHTKKPVYKELNVSKIAPHLNNFKCKSEICLMSYSEYEDSKKKTGIMKYFSPQRKMESSHSISKDKNEELAKSQNNSKIEEKEGKEEIEEIYFEDEETDSKSINIMKEIENEIKSANKSPFKKNSLISGNKYKQSTEQEHSPSIKKAKRK